MYYEHHTYWFGGWFIGAVLVALIAAALNRSRLWFFLGSLVFTPVIMLVVLLVMGKKQG